MILDDIYEFNKTLNEYEYKIRDIIKVKESDFNKYYRVLTPGEFEKYHGGVCWDYVIYQSYYFNKYFPSIKYKVYYQCFVNDKDNPTHTFMIFTYNNKYYWFESSWKKEKGIRVYNSEIEAIRDIQKRLMNFSKINFRVKFIIDYDALNPELFGMSCSEFMSYMANLYENSVNEKLINIKNKALLIKKEVDRFKSEPTGNQNCQLCTWSMECQLRDMNVLPRPIYSPRDVALTLNGHDIVKNPKMIHINNKYDMIQKIKDSYQGSRFYVHVNWKNSTGGHEFMIIYLDEENMYVVDPQVGLVEHISSNKVKKYFNDINYKNSYIVRMDDKELNIDILKYNDMRYLTKWDQEVDIKYMKDHGMIKEHYSYFNEVKKFPVEFDDDGNLTIYKCRMGNISYGDEIDDSVQLLESYRNTSNAEGIKYELARLWFIISDIEKKMTKRIDSKTYDGYVRNRATAMNVFKTNLEYLMKIDNTFNFAEYYNTTPFSDNSIKITNNTLKYSFKALKKFIMK